MPPCRLLNFLEVRKIRTAVELYPECPTQSNFEPMLRSAQRRGLRITEHEWFLNTLATLFSPPHTLAPLKSLRLEVHITWDMMDTAESVTWFDRIVVGLTRLRGIETVDFIVKDKTAKGKSELTMARVQIKAILENVKEAMKEGSAMPEQTLVYMNNNFVVVVNELQRPERSSERRLVERIWEKKNRDHLATGM